MEGSTSGGVGWQSRRRVVGISVTVGIVGALIAAYVIGPRGVALELLLVTPLQSELAPGSMLLAASFAFVAGVSMILTPCGYPLLFALTGASAETTTKSWLRSLAFFSVGIFLAMAVAGVVMSLLGGFLLTTLLDANFLSRVSLSAVVYGSLGIFAIAVALKSLGILRALPPVPGLQSVTQLFSVRSMAMGNYNRRMFTFGAIFGGGMAAGCPLPTYWAILFWVAVTANPVFGALVMGIHALGYAAPVLAIGILARLGISATKSVPRTGERLQNFVSAGMLTTGVFLVSIYLVIRLGTILL